MKVRSTGAFSVVALAAVVALVLLLWRPAAVEAVYPVENAKRTFVVRVWSRVVGLFRGAEANAENVRLRREVAELVLAREDLERVEAENARLRNALGYVARNPGTWQAAEVLSEQGGAAGSRRTVRIDKGSLAGIRSGAVVVVPEGLVGRVTRVTPHTAEVLLVVDPQVRVSCVVETNERVLPNGILSGGSEDSLALKFLSVDPATIEPGTRVVSSGLGGVIPKGIEVGRYLAGGRVRPSVDFKALEDVFVRREK